MEITAKNDNVRVSPRKIRLLVKELKGQLVVQTIAKLKFVNKSAQPPVLELLVSALANAVNSKLSTEKLVIKNILVNEGTKMKRGAKGRKATTDRGVVQKRGSHVQVILEENGTKN
ncbi:MAG: uL22 family ribosomal protein [bacterium]|nr:uL22 family ribosomal protein [bacterium]